MRRRDKQAVCCRSLPLFTAPFGESPSSWHVYPPLHSTSLRRSDRHLMQLALTAFSSTPRKSTAFVVASVLRHFFLQCGPSERGGRWRRGRARSGPHLILWARLPRGRFQGCCPFPQFHRENEFINLEKSLFTGFDSRAL